MAITQEKMDALARNIFLPVILVLDAWVFQYLLTVYYAKRREMRVRMLLVASFLVFATQLYFHEDLNLLMAMNDISETSLQLTFIIQITIIGRAVSVKVRVRSIVWFTYAAEGFIFLGWLSVLSCILEAAGTLSGDAFHVFGNVLESASLVFVLVFRFYYLSLSGGFRKVCAERKMEFMIYVMLVFHEFPFAMIQIRTGVSWEFPQAIGNRVLIITCILLNIRHKARAESRNSYVAKSKRDSNTRSVGPPRGMESFLKKLTGKESVGRAPPTFPEVAKVAVTSAQFSNKVVADNDERSIGEQ
ncbi:hypothetical protein PRIC2_013976 [Phytophthora ramorum]